ncbi:MAG: MGMT family protein [Candidatus Aenigmatarchaeota archaeon]
MKFEERVWKLTSKIPRGKVTTYGEIARKMNTKAYRLVGQSLKKNPDPVRVPCYKVVKSDGSIGGYGGTNRKNIMKKIRLLEKDGIRVRNGKIDLNKYLYRL